MSGLEQVGWRSGAGVLFPLSSHNPTNPGNHAAHKADWKPVFVVAEEVRPLPVLTPAMKAVAEDFARSTRLDRQSLEQAAA